MSNAAAASNNAGASDFVKKLFKMLEDTSYSHIVSWGANGDTFVVKEINEFTKTILPRHFKHSNFASFVRQLNKYDFHKVRHADDQVGPYGEQSWEFKHPDFQCNKKDLLDNIKRKAPAGRKSIASSQDDGQPMSGSSSQVANLQNKVESLTKLQGNMHDHLTSLSKNYQSVISEMLNFQRNMVAQDQLMQNLIQYLVNLEAEKKQEQRAAITNGESDHPFVPSDQAQKLISSYTEVAKASFEQMHEISRRAASTQGLQLPESASTPNTSASTATSPNFDGTDTPASDHAKYDSPAPDSPPKNDIQNAMRNNSGLRVFTVGHLTPRKSEDDGGVLGLPDEPHDMPHVDSTSASPRRNSIRVHRSTFVPGWAVPPKVLLVEDDAVCRRLSSKFLQVFGCAIDVATDGVSAVNKMNLAKYDLVLMDIVMPNLDGVSATSLIRQFDPMTPIISMTSNSNPNEIMTYFSHGMNDILPKPFTKDGLLGMLEKHLIHLKAMRDTAEIPRGLGGVEPPLSPGTANALANLPSNFNFSEMEYVQMLQGLLGQADDSYHAGTKRLANGDDDGHEMSKRQRLEEIVD